MLMKASYLILSAASLGLLVFEAPSGGLMTTTPAVGKVESKPSKHSNQNVTMRSRHFVFIGAYHGGK